MFITKKYYIENGIRADAEVGVATRAGMLPQNLA